MTIIQSIERNEMLTRRINRLADMRDNPDWNRDAYGRKWRLIRRMQDERDGNNKNATIE